MPDGSFLTAPPRLGGKPIDINTDPMLWKEDRDSGQLRPRFGDPADPSSSKNPLDYLVNGTSREGYAPDKYTQLGDQLIRQKYGLGPNDPVPTYNDVEDPAEWGGIIDQVSQLAPRDSGGLLEKYLVPALASGLIGGAASGLLGPGAEAGGGFGGLSDGFSGWVSAEGGSGYAGGAAADAGGLGDWGGLFAENAGDTASDASLSDIAQQGEGLYNLPGAGGGGETVGGSNLNMIGGGPDPTQVADAIGSGSTPQLGMGNQLYNPATGGLTTGGSGMPNGVSLKDLVNYGGNLVSSAFGANASQRAAGQQQDAAGQASNTVRGMYDQTRSDLLPWQAQGRMSLAQLGDLTNGPNSQLLKPFGMEDFKASPGYQFNLEEGMKAINKGAASRGKYYAPSTLQDLGKYAQGTASNEWNNAYGQYNQNMSNIFNRLSSLSSSGQNAATQVGNFGANAASQVGQNQIGAGNAAAAGTVGQANAVTGGLSNSYNQYLLSQILSNSQRSSY